MTVPVCPCCPVLSHRSSLLCSLLLLALLPRPLPICSLLSAPALCPPPPGRCAGRPPVVGVRRLVSLVGGYSLNYYHFITELLPGDNPPALAPATTLLLCVAPW